MADRELYEFAAATTNVPWNEAEACGWFNCPDTGGWLRQLPAGALLVEDRKAAVERMVAVEWETSRGRNRPYMERLLAAAVGEEG